MAFFWFLLAFIMALAAPLPSLSSSHVKSPASAPASPPNPILLPSSPQPASPDISPLLPSPGGAGSSASPVEYPFVPTIPASASPPNPDQEGAPDSASALLPSGSSLPLSSEACFRNLLAAGSLSLSGLVAFWSVQVFAM
ncbi:pectinesterase inhibitor 10 [Malania oleifera]|uniref:pectinesterase inhibitor 10 n=1 Tax=Malania oleifera TaxID=397392 RepID=UPI0025AE3991|nr:pectinesterase inhibitor 10 [Malania oleifera]